MPVLHHIISELLENRNETEGMSEYQEEGTKLRTDEGSSYPYLESTSSDRRGYTVCWRVKEGVSKFV